MFTDVKQSRVWAQNENASEFSTFSTDAKQGRVSVRNEDSSELFIFIQNLCKFLRGHIYLMSIYLWLFTFSAEVKQGCAFADLFTIQFSSLFNDPT